MAPEQSLRRLSIYLLARSVTWNCNSQRTDRQSSYPYLPSLSIYWARHSTGTGTGSRYLAPTSGWRLGIQIQYCSSHVVYSILVSGTARERKGISLYCSSQHTVQYLSIGYYSSPSFSSSSSSSSSYYLLLLIL